MSNSNKLVPFSPIDFNRFLDMGFIESKLKQKLYKTFKQFMDEVFYCINFFREHYANNSPPETSYSNTKKEVDSFIS